MRANRTDTIVAQATPSGRGAIAMVRLSGPATEFALKKFFRSSSPLLPRQATVGEFHSPTGELVDQVIAIWYPGPHSYTGDDLVEISCHGSPLIVQNILECLLAEGVRLARPGEFTQRAFLAGKMDLTQAEAVRDLIESETLFQARLASQQLRGALSARLQPVKEAVIDIVCHLETTLEFVEDDVAPERRDRLAERLVEQVIQLKNLLAGYQLGHLVREGLRVVIAGRPNAGKSSVFNNLIRNNRAIVTAVAGTTRDPLRERVSLQGIPVELIDTAGIRDSPDEVERQGVEKSKEAMAEADVVLLVLDASASFSQEDLEVWQFVEHLPVIAILNKVDLGQKVNLPSRVAAQVAAHVATCALDNSGLPDVVNAILDVSRGGGRVDREDALLSNFRQKVCVDRAVTRLETAADELLSGASEEFPAYNLRQALSDLGEVTGETTVEDILAHIFSSFCIGK